MLALRIALAALAVVLVTATALPLARSTAWWVRMCDFPRLQITVVAAAVLVAYGAVVGLGGGSAVELGLLGALGLATAYQLGRMRPYSPLHRVQTARAEPAHARPERRLRLVVTNVLMQNRDGDRWLDVVRAADPDVVAAVETDGWWAETASALKGTHPHAVELPQDDTYGMCVYSRLELTSVEVRRLVEDEVPSLWLRVRLGSGDEVALVVVHPRPPRPDIRQDSTLRDAELVLAGRDVAELDVPVVVAGDFNDVAWSRTTHRFQALSRLLDPRVGRGLYASFHADHPSLRYPLDHVFHSEHFALSEMRLLDHVGSDHFPVLAELALTRDAPARQDPPAPDADDLDEADAALGEAREMKAEETPDEHAERVETDR